MSQDLRDLLVKDLDALQADKRDVEALRAIAYEAKGRAFAYISQPDNGVARLGAMIGEHAAGLTRDEFESAQTPAELGGAWVEFILTGELTHEQLQDFIRVAYEAVA